MDRVFDRAYARIDEPMTPLEFWALVVPLVAHNKDDYLFTDWPTNIPIDQLLLFPMSVKVPLGMVAYDYAAADYKHAKRGMIPNDRVTHTISDLLSGRDRDMELALLLARGK